MTYGAIKRNRDALNFFDYLPVPLILITTVLLIPRYLPLAREVSVILQVPDWEAAVTLSTLLLSLLPFFFVVTVDNLALQGPEVLKAAIAWLFVVIGRLTVPLYFKALGALNPGMV
jgi:hypothetical protein